MDNRLFVQLPAPAALAARFPLLESLIARADQTSDSLSWLFGVSGELPAGALCLLADGGEPGDCLWMCAEPVHLVADRDRLVMLPTPAPSPEEAEQLCAEFNAHFSDIGWQLHARASRWYLSVTEMPPFSLPPLAEAYGADLRALLPRGREAMRWLARLNEIQMLLHASAVNAGREAAGVPTLNGLWLWGAGGLPSASTHLTNVWADDCAIRGLALAAGIRPDPLPRDASDGHVSGGGLIDLTLCDSVEIDAWLRAVRRCLLRGRCASVTFFLGERAFLLRRTYLLRFWRRRHPLMERTS